MRLHRAEVDAYVGRVAVLLERFGVVLQRPAPGEPIEVLEADVKGRPMRDGFAGIVALMDAWTGDPPDCNALRCLD